MTCRCFLLLALAATVNLQAQAPTEYGIAGVVVDTAAKTPLTDVTVRIAPSQARNEQSTLAVKTDAAGHFSFLQLRPGKYVLSANERGQTPQSYKQHGQFLTAIVVGPGLDSEHVVFPLRRGEGRITGTVTNDEQEPVRNATVYLLAQSEDLGRPRVVISTQRQTTGAGTFRFTKLAPGSYYVAVVAKPWYAQETFRSVQQPDGTVKPVRTTPAEVDEAYPVTYSGNATDAASAQPIAITEGASATADITLHAVPALHLTIPNTGVRPIASEQANIHRPIRSGAQVLAIGPGGVALHMSPSFGPGEQEDEQILSGIAPGTYKIRVPSTEPDGGSGVSEGIVTVAASGPIALGTSRLARIKGHVTSTGSARVSPSFVVARGDEGGATGRLQADGSFTLGQPVEPGRYQLAIQNVAITSIRVDHGSVAGDRFIVPDPAPETMELSVAAGENPGSSVSGVVVSNGKPIEAAMVLLLPRADSAAAAVGRDQSDSDGSFAINDLAPGEYSVIAFDESTKDVPYADRAVMKACLHGAQTVHVPVPQTTKLTVAVTEWPCK